MKERTSAKSTELYTTVMTAIAAKARIEVTDLEEDPDLTFRDGLTRVEQRRVLRDITADTNRAVDTMAAGQNAEAREMAVMIAEDYREYFHDDAVKSERKKRGSSQDDPRDLATEIHNARG